MVRKEIKVIKKTQYHDEMIYLVGRDRCLLKIKEEIRELALALRKNDIAEIKDELSDVENVIPYFSLLCNVEKYRVYSDSPVSLLELEDYFLSVIEFFRIRKVTKHEDILLPAIAKLLACIHNVYAVHKIKPADIEKIKEHKKSLAIKKALSSAAPQLLNNFSQKEIKSHGPIEFREIKIPGDKGIITLAVDSFSQIVGVELSVKKTIKPIDSFSSKLL